MTSPGPAIRRAQPRRAALLLTALALSLSALAGCGADEGAVSLPGRSSPPAPVQAPASLVQSASQILAPGAAGGQESAATPGHQSGGTDAVVGLEDSGGNYRFDPSDLTFEVGETINFTVTAETEFHTFTVDDLGIDEAAGEAETVKFSFKFDSPGTYQLICVPHEAEGMVGTITVE